MREGTTYVWPPDLSETDARARWMQSPPWHVFVAVDGAGTIVGAAKVGPNQEGPGDHVANASFMVDPAAARRGVGRALAEHVIEYARRAGYRAMQFNAVVGTNVAAIALWQKLDFEIVGTIPEAFRHPVDGLVGLHVMYRTL